MEDTLKEVSVAGSEMKTVLLKGKDISNSVKRSGQMLQQLKNACKEEKVPYTTLKNPNDTRWNSRYMNLASIVKLKPALIRLSNEDTTGKWSEKVFSPAEWKLAEVSVIVLKLPLIVTKQWESEKTPTMDSVIAELYGMR